MSMSQEEIEALMNGLDFEEESPKEEPQKAAIEEPKEEDKPQEQSASSEQMSEDDINALISQTEEIVSTKDEESEEPVDVDELLNSIDEQGISSNTEDNIDDVLKEIEELDKKEEDIVVPEEIPTIEEKPQEETSPSLNEEAVSEKLPLVDESVEEEDFNDILASIDGVTNKDTDLQEENVSKVNNDEVSSGDDIDSKINSGVFPLPADQDTKVVNQLSQVANDSEEKATKIFDVLSNILDYNNDIQNDVQELTSFSEQQIQMLSSLNQKFPNIEAFSQNLEQAKKMESFITDINEKLNDGNMEIFQAMELMQYHDINRQKIERVMSVIRKLTVYLNNLFEDETDYKEIAVAKHIHGDSSKNDLMAEDDLDALISEFNK